VAVVVSLVLSALEVASEDLLSISVADLSADETDVVVDFSVFDVDDIADSVSVFAEVVLAVDVVVAVVLSDETSTSDELLLPLQPVSQITDKRINGSSLFIFAPCITTGSRFRLPAEGSLSPVGFVAVARCDNVLGIKLHDLYFGSDILFFFHF
jgi:hypothetical protein